MTEKSGADILREQLSDLPQSPGVYRMLDAEGRALYVGKAKNLKSRVASYVGAAGQPTRILRMIGHTRRLEIVTTKTEAEAFLLEANLIKKLRPRYNILLRDDKSFPFILLQGDHPFPQICKHRGAGTRKGEYFGPFASAWAVNDTVATLEKVFLLRSCSDQVFKSRTRPCLQYQIKRCSAPCVGYVSELEYAEQVDQAKRFLAGKSREVQETFARRMQEASTAMDYEVAAQLRDRIATLTRVQNDQARIAGTLKDADVIALYREGERSCVQVFFFRGGQNFGNKPYFPSHSAEATDAEILTAFLGQLYTATPPPRTILVNCELPEPELLESALSLREEGRVTLITPERGEKRAVMDQALRNAREALVRHLSEHAAQAEMLQRVGELFGLAATPERIEVYDNSHIGGTHMVGALICAGREGFEKKHYRRFNIRRTDLAPGDDYAMLREVLTRRFSRLQREDPGREGVWPDLVLIDGGVGQLSAATQVFAELGVMDVKYAAIAKGADRNAGREWFHLPGREPFQLEPNHPVLHFLERLRDEAHRFAIGSHRIKRSNAIRESALDQIPGIGATRKRALLQHFGSSKGVAAATLEELSRVAGIEKKTAEKIYYYFHP